jgi:hypothetical protein
MVITFNTSRDNVTRRVDSYCFGERPARDRKNETIQGVHPEVAAKEMLAVGQWSEVSSPRHADCR